MKQLRVAVLIFFLLITKVSATCPEILTDPLCRESQNCDWDHAISACITIDCQSEYNDDGAGCEADPDCSWDEASQTCFSKVVVRNLQSMVETGSKALLRITVMILGAPDRVAAARGGVELPHSAMTQLLIFYLIPIAGISSITADILFLMGMLRPSTAKWMGVIVALLGARLGAYVKFIVIIGSAFGGFVGGAIASIFVIAFFGYAMSHIMIGYSHAKAAGKLGTGQEYLQHLGDHVERLSREK